MTIYSSILLQPCINKSHVYTKIKSYFSPKKVFTWGYKSCLWYNAML